MFGTPPEELVIRPGDVLADRFEVERVLGEGGMGVVVAAIHRDLRQRVAVKMMLPGAADSPTAKERFLREARAAVQLRSQHVARVLDVGTFSQASGEAPYIVMELLVGRDLDRMAKEGSRPSRPEIVEYVLQALEAVGEAHALGIVHRDLKPANLFVSQAADGSACVKVLDFGISKLTSDTRLEQSLTKTNAVIGTPHYMSPEQMQSSKHVDARADIWAIGVILYELMTQRVPFHGDTIGSLVARVTNTPPRPPIELAPDMPPALSEVVMRCLEKEPKKRFRDVAELAAALAPFAPERAQVYGSRVARVMEQAAALRHSLGPSMELEVAESPSLAAWRSAPAAPSSQTKLIVAAAVLVVLGVIAGFFAGQM